MRIWPKRMSDSEYVKTIRKSMQHRKRRAIILGVSCVVYLACVVGLTIVIYMCSSGLTEYVDEFGFAAVLGAFAGFFCSFLWALFVWQTANFLSSLLPDPARELLLKYHDLLVAHGIAIDEEHQQERIE